MMKQRLRLLNSQTFNNWYERMGSTLIAEGRAWVKFYLSEIQFLLMQHLKLLDFKNIFFGDKKNLIYVFRKEIRFR